MKSKLSSIWRLAIVLILVVSLSLVVAVPATATSGLTDTPTSANAGASTTHTIAFTTTVALAVVAPADRIVITFPSGFDVSGFTVNAATTSPSTTDPTKNAGATTATVAVLNVAADEAAGAWSLVLDGIKNPGAGTYTISLYTDDGASPPVVKEAAATSASFTITANAITVGPTWTPTMTTAGSSTGHTIGFTTVGYIPVNGKVVITFPAGFNVSGCNSVYSYTGFSGAGFGIAVSGQQVTVTTTAGAPAATAVTLNIGPIVNHTTAANYTLANVKTQDIVGATIDNKDSTGTCTILPNSATYLKVTGGASPTAGTNYALTITAYDQYNNVATGYTGDKVLTFSGPGTIGANVPTVTDKTAATVNVGSPTTVTFTAGVISAGGTLKPYKAETVTINVTDGAINSNTAGNGKTITVAPAAPASYTVVSTSYNQIAQSPFAVTATAYDTYGNVCTNSTETVTYTSSSANMQFDANQDSTFGDASEALVAGVSVINAKDTVVESSKTITATGAPSAATGTSSPYSFTAGLIGSFQVVTSGAGTETAGTAFSVTLTAKDAFNNTDTTYTGAKTVLFTSTAANSPNGNLPTIPASQSITFTLGVGTSTAAFTLVNAAATTITAGDGTYSGTSGAITVAAATVSTFNVTAGPATAGTAFAVTLAAKDAYGNAAASYAGVKAVAFTSTATAAPSATAPTIPASMNLNFIGGGVTTSASFILVNAGQTPTITASATGPAVTGTSAAITVNPGVASRLAFTTTTQSLVAGAPSAVITVQAQDANWNPVTGARTVNLSTTSAMATFSTNAASAGWTNVTAPSIAASASTVSFYYRDQIAGTPTITAASTGLTSATQSETITAYTSYNISLGTSWNLISFPLVPTSTTVSDLITGTVRTNLTKVWTYDPVKGWTWAQYSGTAWTGNLTSGTTGTMTMLPLYGYWVQMSASSTLTVNGNYLTPAGDVPTRSLTANAWYLIGYHSPMVSPVTSSLASLVSATGTPLYDSVLAYSAGGWGKYAPTSLANDFNSMNPSSGYWLHMTAAGILIP